MPCQAMHPIQDLFLDGFSYVLQIDMHFICTALWTKFNSCEKVGVTETLLMLHLFHFCVNNIFTSVVKDFTWLG
jgi:hypothetical protein